jgi:hypothetical protein
MPDPRRVLILTALVASGLAGMFVLPAPETSSEVRRPPSAVFAAAGWSVGEPVLSMANSIGMATLRYASTSGDAGAVIAMSTSPDAKRIYRAGPEIPFAGSGYQVASAPRELVASTADRVALVATRGQERLLLIATYGERRGRLGNGPVAWAAAALDGVLANANDYYLVTLVVPLSGADDRTTATKAQLLAGSVFAEVARWYAR